MGQQVPNLRWGIEQRLEFIEFRLFWEGGVNRADITGFFGVSVPQASKDLSLYQEKAPENIRYDRRQKRYFATAAFRPKFVTLDADMYLERLIATGANGRGESVDWISAPASADRLPIPQRRIQVGVLRSLLQCIRDNRSIEILYQSMSAFRPEPMWRRVSPHAFGSDSLRWHVRAYCHIDHSFKDFILSRFLDTRETGEPGAAPSDDYLWTKHFSVHLCPNPRLSPGQQEVIAQDYAMKDGEVEVPVRRALLYYFNKRLRLDVAERFDDPREAPVVVKNRDAFAAALSEAMR